MWTGPGAVTISGLMKSVLRLLTVLLFALVAATGAAVLSGEPVPAMASDQPLMDMAAGDCEACAPERMEAGMAACGSVCVGTAVAIGAAPLSSPSSERAAQFRAEDWFLSGCARQPELSPPKQFLI